MVGMNKTTAIRKRIATIGIALLILLAVCVMLFGEPFITGVKGMDEGQTVCYSIWNLTVYPVSWTYKLLDENGQPVPADFFPKFETLSEAILIFGTTEQIIKLSRPLPIGSYTLRIVFRYNARGTEHKATSEQRFIIEP